MDIPQQRGPDAPQAGLVSADGVGAVLSAGIWLVQDNHASRCESFILCNGMLFGG